MKFDFDQRIDRTQSISIKWSPELRQQMYGERDIIPMGIADMDFKTAPAVAEAIQRRAAHETYGYGYPAPEYLQACADWQKRRNHWDVKPEWIVYTPGVNMALVCAIEMYTQPGDNVIIQSPVYYPYYDYVRGTGRNVALNALVNREGYYEINFAELEALAKKPETKLMLLCNPHNPVGRAWTKDELERVGRICLDNGVMIAVDEIHGDLVLPPYRHTPFATVSESYAPRPPRPLIWRGFWCRISSFPTMRSEKPSARRWRLTTCGREISELWHRSQPTPRVKSGWRRYLHT